MDNETLKKYNKLYTPSERKQLIAESLKAYREFYNLQQKEVANEIGINAQTYNTYESGRSEPPAEILVRLSMLYNVPVDVLVQKDNMSKDTQAAKEQLELYEKQIQELKLKLANADPNTKAQLTQFLEGMEKLTQQIKDSQEKKKP